MAGRPIIEHHIQACVGVPGLREVLLLGSYAADELAAFVAEMSRRYSVALRYLHEYTYMGTAGGIYHFRDLIASGQPSAFFVINGDVCGDFKLADMLEFHQSCVDVAGKAHESTENGGCDSSGAVVTMLATEATPAQSMNYGCVAVAGDSQPVRALHYVEKPETFVSSLINAGVYVCSLGVLQWMASAYRQRQQLLYSESSDVATDELGRGAECLSLEQHVLAPLAGAAGSLFVFRAPTCSWWSQVKTPAAALYSSGRYLQMYRQRGQQVLADTGTHAGSDNHTSSNGSSSSSTCTVIGNVWIHQTAEVHEGAVLGPNVCVGAGVQVADGVRVRDAILLDGARVRAHALVTHAVLGWRCQVGEWARVQGAPCDPDPNRAAAKVDNHRLFSGDGKLQPSITVLGCEVNVPPEKMVLNCVILPHKELERSYKNEILL